MQEMKPVISKHVRLAGIPIIAVTWGLNRRELLASFSPDLITDTPAELPGCVKKAFTIVPGRRK
jgi:hypothetical protein